MSKARVRVVADAITSHRYDGSTKFDGTEGERLARDLTAGLPP